MELPQRKTCVVLLNKLTLDSVAFNRGRTTLIKSWSQLREPPTLRNFAGLDITPSMVWINGQGSTPSVLERLRPSLGISPELVGQKTANYSISHQYMREWLELITLELQKKKKKSNVFLVLQYGSYKFMLFEQLR